MILLAIFMVATQFLSAVSEAHMDHGHGIPGHAEMAGTADVAEDWSTEAAMPSHESGLETASIESESPSPCAATCCEDGPACCNAFTAHGQLSASPDHWHSVPMDRLTADDTPATAPEALRKPPRTFV